MFLFKLILIIRQAIHMFLTYRRSLTYCPFLLTGVMLGIVILRNINRLTWERTLGWVTLALYLAFVAFCCLFNAFYDDYPPTDWSGY